MNPYLGLFIGILLTLIGLYLYKKGLDKDRQLRKEKKDEE
jgi:hypothetical protein